MLPWVNTCYATTSNLQYGTAVIPSSTGVQQCDALGPLLYSLIQQPVVKAVAEAVPSLDLHGWYLDDATAVGTEDELKGVAEIVLRESSKRGLVLSTAATAQPKSTVWSSMDLCGHPDPLGKGIPLVRGLGVTVLGSPLGYNAFVREALEAKVRKVSETVALLPNVEDPQIEYVLLRACLSLPKLSFLLRTVDTSQYLDVLESFDQVQRNALCRILGTALSDQQWQQARLPLSCGGLGLREAKYHATANFASSLLSCLPLSRSLQGKQEAALWGADVPSPIPQPALNHLSGKLGEEATLEWLWGTSQKGLSLKIDLKNLEKLQDWLLLASQEQVPGCSQPLSLHSVSISPPRSSSSWPSIGSAAKCMQRRDPAQPATILVMYLETTPSLVATGGSALHAITPSGTRCTTWQPQPCSTR